MMKKAIQRQQQTWSRRSSACVGGRLFARSDAGFSLAEVMASMVIFAIAAVGMTATSISVIRANALSRDITAAAALAQDKVEEFRARSNLLGGGSDQVDAAGEPGSKFTRTWTVGDGPTNGTAQVSVMVEWNNPEPTSITTSAYVCRSAAC